MTEGGNNCKPALLSYAGPSGHGSVVGAVSPVLLLGGNTHTYRLKINGTSGQAPILCYTNTSAQ